MSKFLRFGILALAVLAFSYTPASAVRVYLSTSNSTSGGGVLGVPNLSNLQVNQEIDLYVWMQLEANTNVLGHSLDIRASTPGVVEAISSSIVNPDINRVRNATTTPVISFEHRRWNDIGNEDEGIAPDNSLILIQPTINTNGNLAEGASAGSVLGSSIRKAWGKAPTTNGLYDTGYDVANQAFILQSLKLRVLPGAAGKTTDLKLYIGNKAFGISDPGDQPVFFGTGTTSITNSSVGMTDGTVHATLSVAGGVDPGPTITIASHDGSVTTGDVVFNNEGFRFRSAGGITEGRINIVNFPGDSSGNLPLFFDLVDGGAAQALVDSLNANANGAYVAALSTFTAPNAAGGTSTADLVITYSGIPAGSNRFIDFDFGAVAVAAVGVPEPSSIALVGMSVLGLVGYGIRRRRSA